MTWWIGIAGLRPRLVAHHSDGARALSRTHPLAAAFLSLTRGLREHSLHKLCRMVLLMAPIRILSMARTRLDKKTRCCRVYVPQLRGCAHAFMRRSRARLQGRVLCGAHKACDG